MIYIPAQIFRVERFACSRLVLSVRFSIVPNYAGVEECG